MTITPFSIKNCSIASIATGEYAGSILDLRNKLVAMDEMSLYYHFWGVRLSLNSLHRQYHNDFASWAFHALHDSILAERLAIIDPMGFEDFYSMKQELIDIIDERLEDYQVSFWTGRDDLLRIIRAELIIFDTEYSINSPEDLLEGIKKSAYGSIFYHFIDARMRNENKLDDFSIWLKTFGNAYDPLIHKLQSIDPYFLSLKELKFELVEKLKEFLDGRGLTHV